MGNSGTKTGNNEGKNFSNNDDDDKAVHEQLVNNDEDDDDEDDEDESNLEENGGEGGGGEWEPGMEFPVMNGLFPVIRVISNLSTTSLKEVSTRRSKVRRMRRVGSVGGGISEATSFKIYSDTSAESEQKVSTRVNPAKLLGRTPSSDSSDISASDSASNCNWKNLNQNRTNEGEPPPSQAGGSRFPYRSIFAAFLFSMVITGAVVFFTVFFFKQNDSNSTANQTSKVEIIEKSTPSLPIMQG